MIALLSAAAAAWFAPLDDDALADAQAWVESRNDPTAVACPFAPPQAQGHDRDHAKPSLATAKAPCYCGLWQGEAHSAERCLALRDPQVALKQRRIELKAWLSYCYGDLECALAGYGGGVAAAQRGTSGYAKMVLRLADRLRSRRQEPRS